MWHQFFRLLPPIRFSSTTDLSWSRLLLGIFLILCAATPDLSLKASALPIDTLFRLPSPTPTWPPGEGFAKGTIDLGGGLIVSQVTSFNKIWATHQWGPDNLGVSVLEPSPIPDGFFMLGSYGQPNNKPLLGWVLAGKDGGGGALKKPIDYTLVWSSESLQIKQDGPAYFWLPTPPDGYNPVGYVVTNSSAKPPLDQIRCVRSDLADPCEVDSWMWSGNGFNVYSTRPEYRGVEALGVSVGTFAAQNDGSSGLPLSCLKKTRSGPLPCMPNKDQIGALVQAYAPVVYFHPDEEYLPSSVSWFFDNGALLFKAGDEANPVRIDPTGSNLPQGGSNDDAYWLDLGDAKDMIKKGDLQSSEAYFHAKPVLGGTFTDIAMWVFYPFNGPARIKVEFLNISLKKIGEHVGDWEHVTLRISNFNGELFSVYFSKHKGGTWMRASELEFQNGNKFAAYASLHGHAFFPYAGLVLQGSGDVGLRNDAAKSDKVMDTGLRSVVVAAEYLGSSVVEPSWINYMRRWGPKISYDTSGELKKIRKGLIGKLRSAFDKFVRDLPPEALGEAGPVGLKSKANWGGDEE